MKKKGKYYKIAVFVGANRNSQLNVAIECINFLLKNYSQDEYIFYVTDNDKDFLCDTFPCPAIIPVRIGTIGSTHGVKASNSPAK